jgi:hypothetical protein
MEWDTLAKCPKVCPGFSKVFVGREALDVFVNSGLGNGVETRAAQSMNSRGLGLGCPIIVDNG